MGHGKTNNANTCTLLLFAFVRGIADGRLTRRAPCRAARAAPPHEAGAQAGAHLARMLSPDGVKAAVRQLHKGLHEMI